MKTIQRHRNVGSRRRLACQPLEQRRLLAAQISELAIDPLFDTPGVADYIEIRGEPGEVLSGGTYLAVIDEGRESGTVQSVFNLSGVELGSNGYLAILPADSPHDVDPRSAVLRSTADHYAGLPGDVFSEDHSGTGTIEFIIGANAYFLVESGSPLVAGTDVDRNDDGIFDPAVIGQWNVLDSISLHPFVGRGDVANGRIAFAELGTGPSQLQTVGDAPLVWTEGFGYAARVGESTGSGVEDWFQSTIQDQAELGATEPVWGLADNLFGESSQYEFAGRDLTNIGASNFVAGIHGQLIIDSNDAETPPAIGGQVVFADLNDNNVRDRTTTVVDPDQLIQRDDFTDSDYPLINAFDGVTVTSFALNSFAASAVTAERQRNFPNTLDNRIFAKGGIDWFTESSNLRFDFYRPVSSATIVAIGDDNSFSTVFSRMLALDNQGNVIDMDLSGPLVNSGTEVLSVSSETDNIATIYAYADTSLDEPGDPELADGVSPSPFGRFDRLSFRQLEPAAVTDSSGQYEIDRLFPGSYPLRVAGESVVDATPVVVTNTDYQNRDLVLAVPDVINDPILETQEFTIAESVAPGDVIATVTAGGDPGETLRFTINDPGGRLLIDAQSGELSVAEGGDFDFEAAISHAFDVTVNGSLGGVTTTTMTLDVTDVDEAPVVIGEVATAEVVVGQPIQIQLPGDIAMDPEGNDVVIGTDALSFPSWLNFDAITNTLTGIASSILEGINDVTMRLFDPSNPDLFTPLTVSVNVSIGDTPLLNVQLPTDVDGDNVVEPQDALLIINYLRAFGETLDVNGDFRSPYFLDTNGDNAIRPIDVLQVINQLRRQDIEPEASISIDSIDEKSVDLFFARQGVQESLDAATTRW